MNSNNQNRGSNIINNSKYNNLILKFKNFIKKVKLNLNKIFFLKYS